MSFSVVSSSVRPTTPHTTGRLSARTVSTSVTYSGSKTTALFSRATSKHFNQLNSIYSKSFASNSGQSRNSFIVGQNNSTGDLIASDGNGSTLQGRYDGSLNPQVGYGTVINRSPSSQGGRSLTFSSIRPKTSLQPGVGLSEGQVGNADTTACVDDILRELIINPPDPDPPDPDPDPPLPDPEPTNENAPQPTDQPTQPEGCESGGNQQWFRNQCPVGTFELGFANLADGSTWKLCQGPPGNTPSGDGCPVEPESYGYSPVNGSCSLVQNGQFATQEECEQNNDGLTAGQFDYEFFNVSTQEYNAASRSGFAPYTVGSGPCNAASVCCITANWEGGSVQLTGSAFLENCDSINIRNLTFTPNAQ